jgi:hypothetical protein
MLINLHRKSILKKSQTSQGVCICLNAEARSKLLMHERRNKTKHPLFFQLDFLS